jgi:hypothetical protein
MIVAYYTTWKDASAVASTIKDAWVEAIVQDGVNLYVVYAIN